MTDYLLGILFLLIAVGSGGLVFLTDLWRSTIVIDVIFLVSIIAFLYCLMRMVGKHISSELWNLGGSGDGRDGLSDGESRKS